MKLHLHPFKKVSETKKSFINKISSNNVVENRTGSDKAFYFLTYSISLLLTLAVIYPLIYILSCSFSSPEAVRAGRVVLFPVDLSIAGYKRVFENQRVWIGYRNSIFYTVVGTFYNVMMTLFCAYPLTRKNLPYRGFFMFLFTFTMLFGGGLIPTYLVIRSLKLINTPWVMIIPGAIGVTQMIVTRTFLRSTIPDELLEATQIDGCNDFRFFFMFILPLSKAIIAVIAMQYAIGHWNSYFNAFIYLTDKNKYPLQIFLREILVMNQIDTSEIVDPETSEMLQGMADLLKYSLIVVATAPILCIYPFVQKYFVKGIMIGSLKG